MGLQIDLASAGLLGITNATASVINGTATLNVNSVNVLDGSSNYTVTLPSASLNAGDEVVMKKIGTGTVTVASTTIESSNQTITITNNQPIRCLYVNSTVGWLIT